MGLSYLHYCLGFEILISVQGRLGEHSSFQSQLAPHGKIMDRVIRFDEAKDGVTGEKYFKPRLGDVDIPVPSTWTAPPRTHWTRLTSASVTLERDTA